MHVTPFLHVNRATLHLSMRLGTYALVKCLFMIACSAKGRVSNSANQCQHRKLGLEEDRENRLC